MYGGNVVAMSSENVYIEVFQKEYKGNYIYLLLGRQIYFDIKEQTH